MLYAQMNEKAIWPMVWEECQDMYRYLNRASFGYQLILEKRMFATQFGEEYRGALVKWTVVNETRVREVLLETSDVCQMKAALFMLINEMEQEGKKHKRSMVP